MTHPLAAFRQKSGLSKEALAKRIGTTRQSIHRIERREQTPSLALVRKLVDEARANGCDLRADDFMPTADPVDAAARTAIEGEAA